MSIIIAKRFEDECIIISDTKVSIDIGDSSVTANGKMRMSPLEGVLKTQIILPRMCVSFAGDVEVAAEIIQSFVIQKPRDFHSMLIFYQRELIKRESDTQFIIAMCDKKRAFLYKIDKNKIETGDSFWIGDYRAFEDFQQYYHSEKYKNMLFRQRVIHAFEDLIAYTSVQTIGDFSISASYDERYGAFIYDDKVIAYRSKIMSVEANKETIMDEGNAEDGTYMVSVLISDRTDNQVVVLFFDKANVALMYMPITSTRRKLKPEIIRNVTRESLKVYVAEKYQINLFGLELRNGKFNF